MAPDTIPYEIKRLIYDYVDLARIKSLRQVSNAWATVGLEFLLLPSFFIKNRSVDVRRLLDAGSSLSVSGQAAKIRKVIFQNSAWDPTYFRRIVCNRHEQVRDYQDTAFVPTAAEATALEELEEIRQQMSEDVEQVPDTLLISALKKALNVDFIEIQTRNPFQNLILRKVWEEYAVESYDQMQWKQDLVSVVFSAARKAGLAIRHFSHDQLLSCYFEDHYSSWASWTPLVEYGSNLESLKLIISDHQGFLSLNERASLRLRGLLESFSRLEHLSLTFEILGSLPMDFLPMASTGTLRSLSLSSISVDPSSFIALLQRHSSTLQCLRVRYVDIAQGLGSWRVLLEDLRVMFADTLKKSELSGLVSSADGDSEQWLLWPCYDDEWNMLEGQLRTPRTKELEDFVLRGGPWPMVEADRFPL